MSREPGVDHRDESVSVGIRNNIMRSSNQDLSEGKQIYGALWTVKPPVWHGRTPPVWHTYGDNPHVGVYKDSDTVPAPQKHVVVGAPVQRCDWQTLIDTQTIACRVQMEVQLKQLQDELASEKKMAREAHEKCEFRFFFQPCICGLALAVV